MICISRRACCNEGWGRKISQSRGVYLADEELLSKNTKCQTHGTDKDALGPPIALIRNLLDELQHGVRALGTYLFSSDIVPMNCVKTAV
jgi:hypothetical protein